MSPQQPRNNLKVEKYGGFGDSVVMKMAKMFGFSPHGTYPHPYLVSSRIRAGRASEDNLDRLEALCPLPPYATSLPSI